MRDTSTLKAAFVTGSLRMGGATTLCLNLAGALRRLDVEAQLFSMDEDHPLAGLFEKEKIPVYTSDNRVSIFEDRLGDIYNRLRAFEPTTVVSVLSASSFEILRYLPPGVQRIGLALSDDPRVYAMIAQYAPHLDLVAGNAMTIKNRLAGMDALRSVEKQWFPTGVNVPPPPSPPSSGKLRIIFMARLVKNQKRVHLLPEILNHLRLSGRPFHWTIAGDGPDRAWLESSMKCDTEDQTVEFIGEVGFGAVDDVLCGNHVFLLTSDFEGLPLTLVHAMMNGVVPVVSDLESGIPEIVSTNTGVLVAPGNTEDYASAIIGLDKNREQLAQLSANARNFVVTMFSTQTMATRWLEILSHDNHMRTRWADRPHITAPIVDSRKWYYSEPVRTFRRMALRQKARK